MAIDILLFLAFIRVSSNNNFAGGLMIHSDVDSPGNVAFLKSRC